MAGKIAALAQIADLDLKLLKLFKTVVECGGFAAAETELNISRSTISIHMSKLEARLGLSLCQRGRSGFVLSEEGAAVYQAVNRLLEQIEDFRSQLNGLHVQLAGELRILTSDSVLLDPRCPLTPALGEFARQAPKVRLALDIEAMGEIERRVLAEEIHLGVIPFHRELDGLDYLPLYQEQCYLYCGADHPLFAEHDDARLAARLADYPLAHAELQTHPEISRQLAGFRREGKAYYYESRAALLLSGAYLGFLPDQFAASYVAAGRLRALLPQQHHYRLGMVAISKRHARVHRPRDQFLALLRAQLARQGGH